MAGTGAHEKKKKKSNAQGRSRPNLKESHVCNKPGECHLQIWDTDQLFEQIRLERICINDCPLSAANRSLQSGRDMTD